MELRARDAKRQDVDGGRGRNEVCYLFWRRIKIATYKWWCGDGGGGVWCVSLSIRIVPLNGSNWVVGHFFARSCSLFRLLGTIRQPWFPAVSLEANSNWARTTGIHPSNVDRTTASQPVVRRHSREHVREQYGICCSHAPTPRQRCASARTRPLRRTDWLTPPHLNGQLHVHWSHGSRWLS